MSTTPPDPTDQVLATVVVANLPDPLNPDLPSSSLDTPSAAVTPSAGPVCDPASELSFEDQARLAARPVDTRLDYRDQDCFLKDPMRSGVPGWSL